MVDVVNSAYIWRIVSSRGPGCPSGTHLVHDSHRPATLLFPTSTHYKRSANILYIGQIDYFPSPLKVSAEIFMSEH